MIVVEATHKDIAARLRKMDANLRRATKLAVLEAAAAGTVVIAKAAPVDRGRLKQSVRLRRRGESGYPEIVVDAPYAAIIEVGSRPHWVPLTPLVGWVRRNRAKFGITGDGRTRDKAGRFQASGEVIAIARAIQRSIAMKGTRPRWFVRGSIPTLNRILGDCLRRAKASALKGGV